MNNNTKRRLEMEGRREGCWRGDPEERGEVKVRYPGLGRACNVWMEMIRCNQSQGEEQAFFINGWVNWPWPYSMWWASNVMKVSPWSIMMLSGWDSSMPLTPAARLLILRLCQGCRGCPQFSPHQAPARRNVIYPIFWCVRSFYKKRKWSNESQR